MTVRILRDLGPLAALFSAPRPHARGPRAAVVGATPPHRSARARAGLRPAGRSARARGGARDECQYREIRCAGIRADPGRGGLCRRERARSTGTVPRPRDAARSGCARLGRSGEPAEPARRRRRALLPAARVRARRSRLVDRVAGRRARPSCAAGPRRPRACARGVGSRARSRSRGIRRAIRSWRATRWSAAPIPAARSRSSRSSPGGSPPICSTRGSAICACSTTACRRATWAANAARRARCCAP
jgi:hypothetical protein